MTALARLRTLIDAEFANDASITRILLAMPTRKPTGPVASGSKWMLWTWREEDVERDAAMQSRLQKTFKEALVEAGLDPSAVNGVLHAFRRAEAAPSAFLLTVEAGSIAAGQSALFDATIEREWFAISNGPNPHLYPHRRLPTPVSHLMVVAPDGSLESRLDLQAPTGIWNEVPVAFDRLPDVPFRSSFALHDVEDCGYKVLGQSADGDCYLQPIAQMIAEAVHIDHPPIAFIRSHGEDAGLFTAQMEPATPEMLAWRDADAARIAAEKAAPKPKTRRKPETDAVRVPAFVTPATYEELQTSLTAAALRGMLLAAPDAPVTLASGPSSPPAFDAEQTGVSLVHPGNGASSHVRILVDLDDAPSGALSSHALASQIADEQVTIIVEVRPAGTRMVLPLSTRVAHSDGVVSIDATGE